MIACFTKDECLYYDFYEQNNSFHKYRFEIELGSKQFDFGLYLFEEACDNLAYILSALEKMLRGDLDFGCQIRIINFRSRFYHYYLKIGRREDFINWAVWKVFTGF